MTPDEIAKRYDALRKSIPKIVEPNLLVLTCGVAGLGAVTVTGILNAFRGVKATSPASTLQMH